MNSYGGPLTVAAGHVNGLRRADVPAFLIAGSRGYHPSDVQGAPVLTFAIRRLVPALGFAGWSAPSSISWLIRHRARIDLLHIHMSRDLITLPIALAASRLGIPYVVQTHGMVDPPKNRLGAVLDSLATRRALRGAAAVFALTALEQRHLQEVVPGLKSQRLMNGLALPPETDGVDRRDGREPTVLFASRLHSRKRPSAFIRAAAQLRADGVRARFRLVGPDEGQGDNVRELLSELHDPAVEWVGPMAHASLQAELARASVFVLPSIDEPYPMAVLESMAHGTPVIVTESCGLADLIRQTNSGLVVDHSTAGLADAIDTIVTDLSLATTMGENARRAVREQASIDAVVDQLLDHYRASLSTGTRTAPAPESTR
ncbi:glycosyltransferase [Nakamurella sp. YIM 132084]|uniref:Glycosyltransferase n=2 Tax=Nakamurella leprariae TaxID=2803911 RepID=A0A938YEA4_9ACTN|nr:glycosyltransferase [Nakamurella leprariae]